MNTSTALLHRNLIRAAKGALAAWERWLEEREQANENK